MDISKKLAKKSQSRLWMHIQETSNESQPDIECTINQKNNSPRNLNTQSENFNKSKLNLECTSKKLSTKTQERFPQSCVSVLTVAGVDILRAAGIVCVKRWLPSRQVHAAEGNSQCRACWLVHHLPEETETKTKTEISSFTKAVEAIQTPRRGSWPAPRVERYQIRTRNWKQANAPAIS